MNCQICNGPTISALRGRPDYEFGISRQLDYWKCQTCGYVFADPVPSKELESFYVSYTTHSEQSSPTGTFWRVVGVLTPKPDRYGAFASLHVPVSARILDFGCGGGEFLTNLHGAGYTDLSGYDFDPMAAASRLPFVTFRSELGGKFDVIVMNHVIEHVEAPSDTLKRLLAMLTEGGLIYIRTPNRDSMLARLFGSKWRGWETPRHLQVLNPSSLRAIAERAGAKVVFVATSNDMFTGIFVGSIGNVVKGRSKKVIAGLTYVPAAWISYIARRIANTGEEVVAVVLPHTIPTEAPADLT